MIQSVSQPGDVKAVYTWLADGTKLGVRNSNSTLGYEYLSSLVYKRTSSTAVNLESAAFAEGRIQSGTNQEIQYFVTDHLGSTRVALNGSNSDLARYDYTPFGVSRTPAETHLLNRYTYNGKEDQIKFGVDYMDYGARMSNQRIGRWLNVDPLAEKYYSWSPYNFTLNNPVKFIDPDGEDVVYFDEQGKEITRIANDQRFEAYYRVADGREGAVGSELSSIAGSFMQAIMPGLAEGTSYVNLDYQIAASTAIINDKISSLDGLPATANHQFTTDSQIPLLDVNLVKAIVMTESRMGAPGGNGTGASDPMQANYPGDWSASIDVKTAVGLTKNQVMTPQTSINAGIGIFIIKGMRSDSKGNYTTWRGNEEAVRRYNGGGDPNYVKKVYGNYNSITRR